jgi:hypothetical protein
MDVIDGLLRIKKIREDSREGEMRRARRVHEDALDALRRARTRQEERNSQRRAAELQMYTDVCSRVVMLTNLRDVHLEVEIMKLEAQKDVAEVDAADNARQARRTELDACVAEWRQAVRMTRKFEDLSHQARAERLAEAERLADLELEEFPLRPALAGLMQAEGDAA